MKRDSPRGRGCLAFHVGKESFRRSGEKPHGESVMTFSIRHLRSHALLSTVVISRYTHLSITDGCTGCDPNRKQSKFECYGLLTTVERTLSRTGNAIVIKIGQRSSCRTRDTILSRILQKWKSTETAFGSSARMLEPLMLTNAWPQCWERPDWK